MPDGTTVYLVTADDALQQMGANRKVEIQEIPLGNLQDHLGKRTAYAHGAVRDHARNLMPWLSGIEITPSDHEIHADGELLVVTNPGSSEPRFFSVVGLKPPRGLQVKHVPL